MAIFLIVPTASPEPLKTVLDEKAGSGELAKLDLPRGEFMVSYKGTSKELSDLLGITSGEAPNAVVALVGSYFGRAPTNVWEWVQSHWEQ